jgi:hypothetical protein
VNVLLIFSHLREIIIAFAILAGLSLVISVVGFFMSLKALWKKSPLQEDLQDHATRSDNHDDVSLDNEWPAQQKRFLKSLQLDVVENTLESISEVQLFNGTLLLAGITYTLLNGPGLALLIAAIFQRNSLSLYHMHIVYDTVNFTA